MVNSNDAVCRLLTRRQWLRSSLVAGCGLSLLGMGRVGSVPGGDGAGVGGYLDARYPFALPPLGHAYPAFEPAIDRQTMEIHYLRHHGGQVAALNRMLAGYPQFHNWTLRRLLADHLQLPESIRQTVVNNAGGHANHCCYWQTLAPQPGAPDAALAAAIAGQWGGHESLAAALHAAGMRCFGSGWAWLARDADRQLRVVVTANQDNPLMDGLVPLLGVDVWEHAYYLHYQNRRADYLTAWLSVVDWRAVSAAYAA
jgi:superoxide dismutase, Fe-Mn family